MIYMMNFKINFKIILIIIRDILIILWIILCLTFLYKVIEKQESIEKNIKIIAEQLQIDDITITN